MSKICYGKGILKGVIMYEEKYRYYVFSNLYHAQFGNPSKWSGTFKNANTIDTSLQPEIHRQTSSMAEDNGGDCSSRKC